MRFRPGEVILPSKAAYKKVRGEYSDRQEIAACRAWCGMSTNTCKKTIRLKSSKNTS